MSKCNQCNVIIRDATQVCPLCHCVIQRDETAINTYPDIRIQVRRLKKLTNIWLFVLLVISSLLVFLNYKFYHGMLWSLIPVGAMLYCYLLLRYAVLSHHGYRGKILTMSLTTVLLVILIDFVSGFHRWSLTYVFPAGIIVVNIIIVFMMLIFNRRNWQSYIVFQLGMILISLTPLLLWHFELITSPTMSQIAFASSAFLFLGTLIIGDRRARVELWRRFHI